MGWIEGACQNDHGQRHPVAHLQTEALPVLEFGSLSRGTDVDESGEMCSTSRPWLAGLKATRPVPMYATPLSRPTVKKLSPGFHFLVA